MKGLLALTALFTGLIAGLFFAYSFSVVPGLGRLSDEAYLRAMQSINRAIQNPFFFTPFFAALLLLPLSAARAGDAGKKRLLLAGAVVYTGGVMASPYSGMYP